MYFTKVLSVILLQFVLMFCVHAPPAAEGATIYRVTVGGAGIKSGDSWNNAMSVAEFRTKLVSADSYGEYWLATGKYTPHESDRAVSFVLKGGVELYGGFAGIESAREQRDMVNNKTILTGDLLDNDNFDIDMGGYQLETGSDNSYHVVRADGVDDAAVLDGFVVTGGNANGVDDARYGGGMHIINNARPTIINCAFSGNSAAAGGGGMYNSQSSPTLTNCTFSNNYGSWTGGGMNNSQSSPVLTNCTFSGNRAAWVGDGMLNAGSSPTVTNCIFWRTDSPVNQIFTSEDGVPMITYSIVDVTLYPGTGNTNVDPKLGPLADNGGPTKTHALADDSPARSAGLSAGMHIIAGKTIVVPDKDQRGAPRPVAPAPVHIGAYQHRPAIRYVNAAAGGANDGTSWTDAHKELRDALLHANNGDEIWVAEGSYKPTADEDRTKSFELKNGVALFGGFPATGTPGMADRDPEYFKTILTGDLLGNDGPNPTFETLKDNSHNVVRANHVDETAVLDGFIVTAGQANFENQEWSEGAGMRNFESSPTVRNCVFSRNRSTEKGAGMYNNASNPTVTNCIFSSNTTLGEGGGMYNVDSSPTITNCIFSNNNADIFFGGGGGMYNSRSNPTITNCTFEGNIAKGVNIGHHGGGI